MYSPVLNINFKLMMYPVFLLGILVAVLIHLCGMTLHNNKHKHSSYLVGTGAVAKAKPPNCHQHW